MRKPSRYLLIVMLLSIGIACFVEHRVFQDIFAQQDVFALNDDVRNQIYWLARLTDPHLFPHDYIASYFAQPFLVSPVVHGLYGAFSLWANPLILTQFLPLFLVGAATFFLFRLCANFKDETFAFWVAFSFNVSIWLIKDLAGGLPRAFTYPLLFCLLWALQARRWIIVAVTLWLSVLIYPPVFVLGLGTLLVLVLSASRPAHRDKATWPASLRCLALTLAGSLVVAAWRLSSGQGMAMFGPLTNAAMAEHMRDCYWGGRIVVFAFPYIAHPLPFPLNVIMFVLQRLPHFYILIPLFIFGILLLLYRKCCQKTLGPLLVPNPVRHALTASIVLYVLAWPLLFYLYVPERYLEYTFLLLISFIFGSFVYLLQRHFLAYKAQIGAGFMVLALLGAGPFWRSDLMRIPQREKLLYAYLKQLPKDTMIAASPGLASNIPLFSLRSVLLSNEAYIPFHQRYFHEMKARLRDWLNAYYATDPGPVLTLVSRYKVKYLIVQMADFTPKRLRSIPRKNYYAFDPTFFSALQRPGASGYYLLHLSGACVSYRTEFYRVIDVARCWPQVE